MKKVILGLAMMLFTQQVLAGSSTGKIKWLRVRASDNLHYFIIDGSHNERPSCATSQAWTIKDENSAAGKSQISILLSAWATGKTISVNGDNKCTRWGDQEDANEIFIN